MKRSNMKSDIAVRSNCKPEGRIFPRRKVASKSHLLNGGIGDFEMELSLAIQESLKYSQQGVKDSKDNKINNVSEDDKGKCASVDTNDCWKRTENEPSQTRTSSDLPSEEVGRMKDLLLAQAELIQCQQEEITIKDKELKILRLENDNLQCRLTRMERRLSMMRQKDGSQEALSSQTTDELGDKANNVDSLSMCNNFKRKGVFHKPELKKRHKRHRLTSKKCKWRTLKASSSISQSEAAIDNEDGAESDRDAGESSIEDDSASDVVGSDNESVSEDKEVTDKHSDDEDEYETSRERTYIDYPVMQTEIMYHLYYPKHLYPCIDAKKIQERAAHQLEVETPTWRMNPLTNLYQLEGTENITDEAYFKRHQKFELEEKRRKRWDLQRLRELRMFEKFQEEKESALRASHDEADVETFLPSIHDLTHIEMSSTIPVMAFGQPLPYVTPAEFEIPWEINNSSSSSRYKINGGKGSKRH